MSVGPNSNRPAVFLVGAGVVGRAILQAHLDAGVSVCLVDQLEEAIVDAVESLPLDADQWFVSSPNKFNTGLSAIELISRSDNSSIAAPIVIESIAERLDAKQDFFSEAEQWFGSKAILCSNTSTLRIGKIAEALRHPQRFCGMHFFMPVDQRDAVELVSGPDTSEQTIQHCIEHARRIGKEPLVVGDGPGFVVNRLLCPYLNEALLLLSRGVSADQIEHAALAYGMPISPLELIDWIGTRTMFDAGRVFWQAFPDRLNPSPLLVGMVKRERFGRASGRGLYDYVNENRSPALSPVTVELCEQYRRHEQSFRDEEVLQLLSIPMWIEAAFARRDGIAQSNEQLNSAMRGGLGYDPQRLWLEFFEHKGSNWILQAIEQHGEHDHSLRGPEDLVASLRECSPTEALDQFVGRSATSRRDSRK